MYSDGEPMLFEDDVFKVEIPLTGIPTADKPPITADKAPIGHQQTRILEYIKENGSISNAEACKVLGLKSTRAKEILRGMVDAGLISALGENKSRIYELSKK